MERRTSNPSGREIELKLEVPPETTEWLTSHRSWLKASGCQTERLSSVYYDTADCLLRRSGYSLRVRSNGNGFIQTLKSLEGGAGMFERGEWEDALEGPDPDLARLAHTPAAYLKIEKLDPEDDAS